MTNVIVDNLKCEYTKDPLGLDIAEPQFSWEIKCERRGFVQKAYRIIVKLIETGTNNKSQMIWDSGKISSSESAGIRYEGPELESRACYQWMVKIWDTRGQAYASAETAFFEMGLMKLSDWKASWIGCPASWPGRVLYFRNVFSLSQPVSNARVYISGLGYYVLYINGEKVGDHVLDPGLSDYSKRIYYSTYDVTQKLQKLNIIAVTVAPGWYGIPKLRMQLDVTFDNGSSESIPTMWDPNNPWLVAPGPVIRASVFDGEYYDARREIPGWDNGINAGNHPAREDQWINAVVTEGPGGQMVSQLQEPIKVIESLRPKNISQVSKGVYLVEAEKNLAGWAKIRVRGRAGTLISMKFGETLNSDGTVNQENLRSAGATDYYILKGEGLEEWEPSFTYHGFRYIQVEGFPGKLTLSNIQIRVVRSNVEQVGYFHCSNHLLNRIHMMVNNTESSNLHSVPTDCPQRDERMAWLNDMTVRIDEALYNFDLSRFYSKWIKDIRDTQSSDGSITDTAPFRWGFRPADPVSASYLLLALKCYDVYGNKNMIEDHYNGLKSWVDYLYSRTNNGILNYSHWGDWSPPEAYGTPGSIGSGAVSKETPGNLISTGFLYYCSVIISRFSEILQNNDDTIRYRKIAQEVSEAFNQVFWDSEKGGYGSNNQACNSFALFLKIIKKENISRVVHNLVENVKIHDYHLTTGNICTKYLLESLTEYGYPEVAYRIAVQESYPGWGYMLAHGATTLWERWENKTGGEMNSHNHPMLGSIDSWFFKYLAGIFPDPQCCGYNKFFIKPYVLNDLKFVKAEFKSIKGLISSSWKKKSGYFFFEVTIPANSTAKVFVLTANAENIIESDQKVNASEIKFLGMESQYAVFEVGSGRYFFKSELPERIN